MKKIAIYPGTFDPVTLGHIDVIERSALIFDEVIVVLAINLKKQTLFSETERLEMLRESLQSYPNVRVISYRGLVADAAKEFNASVIIRGIRAVSDFEYEFQMALTNRKLKPDISTIFFMPNEKYTYLNSTIIRELASFGQNVDEFVPACVSKKLKEKFAQ